MYFLKDFIETKIRQILNFIVTIIMITIMLRSLFYKYTIWKDIINFFLIKEIKMTLKFSIISNNI
uniref:Uncharacterized protein n=1 Tax=Arsenophonus nasoniae TaxID=638 RepID=D2TVY5_9GAMM|nr:hypothetical protein ARN_01910 [Arsenophonus nasoniae]